MEDEVKLEEQMVDDINTNCLEDEATLEILDDANETDEEKTETLEVDDLEVQTTFNEDSVEELIDEEGSVENVSY